MHSSRVSALSIWESTVEKGYGKSFQDYQDFLASRTADVWEIEQGFGYSYDYWDCGCLIVLYKGKPLAESDFVSDLIYNSIERDIADSMKEYFGFI